MRALGVWSLLALACVTGCGLSPGQDLPSANSDGESGDGDFLAPPGDPIVVVPPSDSGGGGSCSSGGGGGMGGSADTGGSIETGGSAETSGDCSNTPSDR